MPMFKRGYIALVLISGSACGGPASAPTPTPTPTPSPLHGEVSDPVGDTLSDPRVPVPPDLVHATADVAAGNITFVVQFASGTFDSQTTRATVLLDIDQNASTGIRQADGLGADFAIDLTASTSTAGISKAVRLLPSTSSVSRLRLHAGPDPAGRTRPVKMMRRAMSVTAVVLVGACSSSTSPATPSGPTSLIGTVTDRIGDALVVPGVPISPDLTRAAMEAGGGNLTITVSYASGTMSQTRSLFFAYLDTDENPATGNPGVPAGGGVADANLIGWDYAVGGVDPADSGRASVLRATGSGGTVTLTSIPVTFPSPDQIRIVVPISLFGNISGRMTFKIACFQWLGPQPPTSSVLDYMPDLGASPGVVR
jgi:hypothetical protein